MWLLFFYETACGCADLVIISDLPMISLNHLKSYTSNSPLPLTIPTYYFNGSTDIPKHIQTRLMPWLHWGSSLLCGVVDIHSAPAPGGLTIEETRVLPHGMQRSISFAWCQKYGQQKHTLCALLPCKWNQGHWDLSIAIVQVMNNTVFTHHHRNLVRPMVPNIDHENGLC